MTVFLLERELEPPRERAEAIEVRSNQDTDDPSRVHVDRLS